MSEWAEISGDTSTRSLWVSPYWEGKPKLGPFTLEDGRDIIDLIETGKGEELGFPFWFRRTEGSRDKRLGDILWTGGLAIKVVSKRFLDALTDLGVADGLQTYPATLVDRRGRAIEGAYYGAVEHLGHEGEINAGHDTSRGFSFTVSTRVLEGLRARDVTGFKVNQFRADKSGDSE